MIRFPRLIPRDAHGARKLATRTLASLYNERPAWLPLAQCKLDEAVFAGHGWDVGMSDENLLERNRGHAGSP